MRVPKKLNSCPIQTLKFRLPLSSFSLYFLFIVSWRGHDNNNMAEATPNAYGMHVVWLERLAEADIRVASDIIVRMKDLIPRSPQFETFELFIRDFESGTGIPMQERKVTGEPFTEEFIKKTARAVADNPITAYKLLQRQADHHEEVYKHVTRGIFPHKVLVSPNQEDIDGMIASILRIQHYLHLPTAQIARGNFSGILTGVKLDAVHAWEVGIFAAERKHYALAVEWLELAMRKATYEKDNTVERSEIELELESAMEAHNAEYKSSRGENPRLFGKRIKNPKKTTKQITAESARPGGVMKLKRWVRKPRKDALVDGVRVHNRIDHYFEGLCSGKNYQTEKEKARLFCWLEFKIHPMNRLAPIRMEFLSRNPDVVQMYNVISDYKMEFMFNESRYLFHRNKSEGPPADRYDVRSQTNEFKVYTNARLSDRPQIRFDRILARTTGLKRHNDTISLQAYPFGGNIQPHCDTHDKEDRHLTRADRVAVFQIYIEDVTMGGYTGFPKLGVAAKPIKGSALVWYNTYSNKTVDTETLHGGCPVIYGRKVIAAQELFLDDQDLSFKCPITRGRRYRFPVNGVRLTTRRP